MGSKKKMPEVCPECGAAKVGEFAPEALTFKQADYECGRCIIWSRKGFRTRDSAECLRRQLASKNKQLKQVKEAVEGLIKALEWYICDLRWTQDSTGKWICQGSRAGHAISAYKAAIAAEGGEVI